MIVNGDFETGDLTGWTDDSTGWGTYTATATVGAGYKHSGTYGLRLYGSALADSNSGLYTRIHQHNISTDFDTFSMWYKVNTAEQGSASYFEFFVWFTLTSGKVAYPVDIYTSGIVEGDWVHVQLKKADIPTTGGSWDTTTTFSMYVNVDNGDQEETDILEVFVDDIIIGKELLINGGFEI